MESLKTPELNGDEGGAVEAVEAEAEKGGGVGLGLFTEGHSLSTKARVGGARLGD